MTVNLAQTVFVRSECAQRDVLNFEVVIALSYNTIS